MRRLSTSLAIVAISAALLAPATLAGEAGGGPKATGDVTWGVLSNVTVFTAQLHKNGPKGTVSSSSTNANFDFTGTVTCYAQSGDTAFFSGVVTGGRAQTELGFGLFHVRVTDNGEGADADADLIRVRTGNLASNFDCQNPGTFANNPLIVLDGNVQVHQPDTL